MALIDILDPKVTGPLLDKLSAEEQAIVQKFLDDAKSLADSEVDNIASKIEVPLLEQLAAFNQTAAKAVEQITRAADVLERISQKGFAVEAKLTIPE